MEGNADLYGLGIRLGVYFQLVSTLFANHLLPDEISYANSIFLLVVFVAVARATASRSIQWVEAFLMLQLMLAFMLSVVPTHYRFSWKFRGIATIMKPRDIILLQKHYSVSEIGRHWRAGLATAVACYNVWFWFAFEPPSSCTSYIFLFTKASPHPVSQVLYKLFAIAYVLVRGLMYLFNLVDLLSIPQVHFWTWKPGLPSLKSLKTCAWQVLNFYHSRSRKGDERYSYYRDRIHEHQ